MGVRIAGERLPGRLNRRRVDSGDRVGLREVEDERRLEEDAPLLAILAVAGFDGDRREDPDCLLALADCAPELDPGVEPGDVLGDDPALMGLQGDQNAVRRRICVERLAGAHPPLAPLR
jgi:hypothetical protein